jgi:hypothetical protein
MEQYFIELFAISGTFGDSAFESNKEKTNKTNKRRKNQNFQKAKQAINKIKI